MYNACIRTKKRKHGERERERERERKRERERERERGGGRGAGDVSILTYLRYIYFISGFQTINKNEGLQDNCLGPDVNHYR